MDRSTQRDSADEAFEREALAGNAGIAEAVRNDFSELVEILNRQLAGGKELDARTMRHIAQAKSAAERGVSLSNQLLGMLRTIVN